MIPRVAHHGGVRGLHRVSPGTGILFLGCALFGVLGTESLAIRSGVLILVFSLAMWSEGSARAWVAPLRFALAFSALLFLAQILSVREGVVLFRVGISITSQGLWLGAGMALRFLVILSASFLFVVTTDPDALAGALIRWGIPYRYGFTLILALRFVPFFRRELRTVREAQRLRGVQASVRSINGIRRAIQYTFIPVLVAGLIRVDTIAMSMKGRAFGALPTRTADPHRHVCREDVVAWCCSAVIVLGTVIAWRTTWF